MAATTDRQGAGSARPRVAPPRLPATVGSTLGAFLLALAVLAWQMSAGRDPVLGHGFAAVAAAPRQVVVRRVVITRVQPADVVVVRKVRHQGAAAATVPPPRPVTVRTVVPARPARPAPAPVSSSPAPKPSAPPAKQPAPPTTHQS
jgi:hypothetical protein